MEQNYESQRVEYNNRDERLEYLMRRFGNKVIQLAYSYLRDRDEAEDAAEDAAQEVFLRVYKSLDKIKVNSNPYTWIYTITVNLCRDKLKKKQFFKWEYLNEESLIPRQNDPEQQVIRSVFSRILWA